jgi:RHS repeat-associated protein
VRNGFAYSAEFQNDVGQLCVTTSSTGASIKYVLSDVQGTTRAVMNNNGSSSAVVARHDYLPFGEEIWTGTYRSSGYSYGVTDANRQKYGLTERDDATGLDHAAWRKLESLSGRWTSPDPYNGSMMIGDPQSHNRYNYTQNDPVNFLDPSGLDDSPPDCGPGTTAEKDAEGHWQCVGTGVSTVTVTGGWDDMSDYLPDWTSDDLFMLVTLLGGQQQEGTLLHELGHANGTQKPHCGVNPVTGRPGFTNDPRGVPGDLRPGKHGEGYFGASRKHGSARHAGLDISGVLRVSPIYANRAGTITFVGPTPRDAGNLVIIDHGGGVSTRYGHLSSFASGLAIGDEVDEADEIGILGNTGNARNLPASEAHVHFGVQINGRNVDPANYLNSPCP